VLDLPDQAGVGGVPGPGPHPDRDPVAGDGHPDDDLREVVAGVLGLAVGAEPGLARDVLAAGGNPLAAHVARNVLVCLFRLEIGGCGIEEKQVHLKIKKVGDLVIRLLGQVRLDREELVHRPVAGVVGDVVEAVDMQTPGTAGGTRRDPRVGQAELT
jgi:hypothetical protein